MRYHHFKNLDQENDRRVRLVPKSETSAITPEPGETLEMVNLGTQGVGFCLSKAAGITCVGAKPGATIYQIIFRNASIPATVQELYIDGILTTEAPPTWLNISMAPSTPDDYAYCGVTPEQAEITVLVLTTSDPAPHRIEFKLGPADQNQVQVKSKDPMVITGPEGFGVCIQGAPPEPNCSTARIGVMIQPDLFYSDERSANVADVYDVVWSVEVNGQLLPRKADGKDIFLEDILKDIPGLVSAYVPVQGDNPISGVYVANQSDDAVKIRLVPNKLFPTSRVNFADIETEEVLNQVIAGNTTGVVPVTHPSVFIASDCSINICLAPKGTVPPKGITCAGAEPYIMLVVAQNPNFTIQVTGLSISVDDVEVGMSFPADKFINLPAMPPGYTQEQLLDFARNELQIDPSWSLAYGGTIQSISPQDHKVRIHLLPANQDMVKYIMYSPWGNELYSDGGMGACIREGASIPRAAPFQCDGAAPAMFIQGTFETANLNYLAFNEYDTQISGHQDFGQFIAGVDDSGNFKAQVVEGGFIIQSTVGFGSVKIRMIKDDGFASGEVQFYNLSNAQYNRMASGEVIPTDQLLVSPAGFWDDADKSIKLCFAPQFAAELYANDIEVDESKSNYPLKMSWDSPLAIGGSSDLIATTGNSSIASIVGYNGDTILLNIGEVGETTIKVSLRSNPSVFKNVKITRTPSPNRIRILTIDQNTHDIKDTDGIVIGKENKYNIAGGIEGQVGYLSYTATFDNNSSAYIIDPTLLFSGFDPTIVTPEQVEIDWLPDVYDGSTSRWHKRCHGLIKLTYLKAGNTELTLVPKFATHTAQNPITYSLNALPPTTDMVLQVLPEGPEVEVEVASGAGKIIWPDGAETPYTATDVNRVFKRAMALGDPVGFVRIQTNEPTTYIRTKGFANVLNWLAAGVDKLFFETVMSVPPTTPPGIKTFEGMFKNNVFFNGVIRFWQPTTISNFSYFLSGARKFNQNIGKWPMTSAVNVSHMLERTAYDFNIDWDTSNMVDLSYFLSEAANFASWFYSHDFRKATNMDYFLWNTRNYVSTCHFQVPLIATRPTNYDSWNQNGPLWGETHVYDNVNQYVVNIDEARNLYYSVRGNSNHLGVMVVEVDGKIVNSGRGAAGSWESWNTAIFADGSTFKPNVDSTITMKMTSGYGKLGTFMYPSNVYRVIDWVTFKVDTIGNLPQVTQVPADLSPHFGNISSLFRDNHQFNDARISSWNTENIWNMSDLLNGCTRFNQNIGGFKMMNVTMIDGMLANTPAFNQDLKHWCIINITSEPTNFAVGSGLSSVNKPVWGTCPFYYDGYKVKFNDGSLVTYPDSEIPDNFAASVETSTKKITDLILIGGSVTTIGENAFKDTQVRVKYFNDSLRLIKKSAFENVTNFSDPKFFEGVIEIQDRAFWLAAGMGSHNVLRFPNSLKVVGKQVTKCRYTVVGSGITSMQYDSFTHQDSNENGATNWADLEIRTLVPPTLTQPLLRSAGTYKLHVPTAALSAYQADLNWSSNVTSIDDGKINIS